MDPIIDPAIAYQQCPADQQVFDRRIPPGQQEHQEQGKRERIGGMGRDEAIFTAGAGLAQMDPSASERTWEGGGVGPGS